MQELRRSAPRARAMKRVNVNTPIGEVLAYMREQEHRSASVGFEAEGEEIFVAFARDEAAVALARLLASEKPEPVEKAPEPVERGPHEDALDALLPFPIESALVLPGGNG